MKKILIGAIILIFSFTITSPLFADDNKIDDKFDLAGTYQNISSDYAWGDVPGNAMWNYNIHVKVAKDTTKSKGTVHFSTDGVEVVGHVEDVKYGYDYSGWASYGQNLLATVGWANYNGQKYHFMFLYCEDYVWFALSETSYEVPWSIENVWSSGQRAFQTHSKKSDLDYYYKDIH